MDRPENLMVVSGFFRFATPVARERLEAALREGLLRYDRFRQRVEDTGSALARPRWVDCPDFDLDRHLGEETLAAPGDDGALAAAIEPRLATPLPRDRPLWEMRLLHGYGAGSALLFRVHHAMADGIALLQVLLDACEPAPGAAREAPQSRPKRPWHWWALLPLTAPLWALSFLGVATWLIVRPQDPDTVYRAALTGRKRIAWTPPLPLAEVKALATAAGCKINDLLMTVAAGALRRHAAERGRPARDVRALVPVNMRPASRAGELGNAFSLVSPTLPLAEPAGHSRLRLVKRRMDRLKRSPEAHAVLTVVRLFGFMGARLQHRIQRFLIRKTSLVMTNVPGPRRPLAMAGATIERVMFWVPMFGPTALGLSIFTYADELSMGVLSDEAALPEPAELARAIVAELDHLRETLAPTAR